MRVWITWTVALAIGLGLASAARAQQPGEAERVQAATNLIILRVQQQISSLPPASGQSFVYEFDAKQDLFVRSERLGPSALESPQSLGSGKLSLRLAGSYFSLSDTFSVPYTYTDALGQQFTDVVSTSPKAKVGVISLAAAYGITDRGQVSLNIPGVIVDASLSGSSMLAGGNPSVPLDTRGFNSGTQAGLGRIALSGKYLIYGTEMVQIAGAADVNFASPSSDEFAGSDSYSLYPRIVASLAPSSLVSVLARAGYEWDLSTARLSRFAWSVGASAPATLGGIRTAFDAGFNGSLYSKSLDWTPSTLPPIGGSSNGFAVGSTSIGKNNADFILGVKAEVVENLVLSGIVSVPIDDQEFRPDAAGTLAIEYLL